MDREPVEGEQDRIVGGATDGDDVPLFTAMQMGATMIHELFRAYCEAGFSESQALYVVGVVLAEQLRKAP